MLARSLSTPERELFERDPVTALSFALHSSRFHAPFFPFSTHQTLVKPFAEA